jgi:hypothetical protein
MLKDYPAFFYRIAYSWGLAPHPERWRDFQKWFHQSAPQVDRPYVQQAELKTYWYKRMETETKADTMWTMWYIYYCNQNNLYGLISNVPEFFGYANASIACHRKELGMHYASATEDHPVECDQRLLKSWSDDAFANCTTLPLFDYDGTFMKMV